MINFLKYKKLTSTFYNRNTEQLAKDLLGKIFVRNFSDKILAGKIIETEAYNGPKDKANHAHKGKTDRTAIMFDTFGFS